MNIPKGYKLVPVVATLEMKNAGWRECGRQGIEPEDIEMQTIWTAMHLEAPTPPQPIYDEAKERELFAEFSRRIIAHDAENFPIRWCDCVPDEAIEDHLNTWLACAQPRPKAVEVGHE